MTRAYASEFGGQSVLNKSTTGTDDIVSLDKRQIKAIEEMFKTLPKRISQDGIWKKFWIENTKPLIAAAQSNVKDSKKDHKYPREKNLTIKSGTLKESIGFFRTKASQQYLGGYVGPRVKGKYRKEKGGFYGAWVEYGDEVNHYGKFKSKANPFMAKAWQSKYREVLANGMKDAEEIFTKAIKADEKRMKKFGRLGY